MPRTYSIAEAKSLLGRVVHEAEEEAPVELTRRGRPVAFFDQFLPLYRLGLRSDLSFDKESVLAKVFAGRFWGVHPFALELWPLFARQKFFRISTRVPFEQLRR